MPKDAVDQLGLRLSKAGRPDPLKVEKRVRIPLGLLLLRAAGRDVTSVAPYGI